MKRIVASVGLVALGASSLQTTSAQELAGTDTAKPWSVSATLRGFYDDNINSLPSTRSLVAGDGKRYSRTSTGYELSPSATYTWDVQQTKLDLSYAYSLKYYDNKHYGDRDNYDQDHTFTAALTHAFNERWKLGVNDSFAEGQEPDALQTGAASQVTYQSGDNYRNYGSVVLDGQLTPTLGTQIGYDNTFYHYNATGSADLATGLPAQTGATLNRIEQGTHLEGRLLLLPETSGLFGFRFRDIDYNSDKTIGFDSNNGNAPVNADRRNLRLYAPYVGLEHNFTPQATASVRVGANYADHYNDHTSSVDNWSPYVASSLKYTYAPESYVEVGFTHDINATDQTGAGASAGSLTVDEESSTVSASINHRILPKLYGSLIAQFQDSSFNGGDYNNKTEDYYTLGANLEYRITQNFSTHVGYNYDNLQSDLSRGYNRNRVYIGLTASY